MERNETFVLKRKVADYCVILIIYLIAFGIFLAYYDSVIGPAGKKLKIESSSVATPSITNTSVKGIFTNDFAD